MTVFTEPAGVGDILNFLAGHSKHTWQPTMTAKTNVLSYWFNWRFLLCAIWIFTAMFVSAFLIWKYEAPKRKTRREDHQQKEKVGKLHEGEAWSTCVKTIHPAWLLAYRVIAFFFLFALIITNVAIDGGYIFYFYTQWTFTLVTIYFGFGSVMSIYGCFKHQPKNGGNHVSLDAEQGSYVAPTLPEGSNTSNFSKNVDGRVEPPAHQIAGVWSYTFQIMFQMSAGAVMLTDTVFWLILYPFLTSHNFRLNFLVVGMHSVNAIFLLGDAILNGMRFPLFRIAYFVLWTCIFVVFQWIIHACVSLWWPYPFLDLSSKYAPLWYLGVGVMHIPCYGIFALIIRLKHFWLSRSFPQSYRRFGLNEPALGLQ
ncbi:hypothetical protein ACFE04_025337 [Oxalis oulophora]